MLSIITVTWNNEHTITDQIKSVILACDGLDFEEIVVDNNSGDKTVEVLKEVKNSIFNIEDDNKKLKIIKNEENLGFAKANNVGFKKAKGDYVLFLNPDMKLKKGTLKELVNYLKVNEDVGIISPKLKKENGEFNLGDGPRRFPRMLDIFYIFSKLSKFFPKVLDGYYYKDLDIEKEQEVDSLRGAFMLFRKKDLESVGVWDERYFCWFEDVDLCRKIKKIGKKIIYYPRIEAIDLVGQSFKKRSVIWKQWTFFKSSVKYFRKWGI